MKKSPHNLTSLAAKNCRIKQTYRSVDKGVKIKVIHFEQPQSPYPPILFVAGWITLLPAWRHVLQHLTRYSSVHYVETREKRSAKTSKKTEYSISAIAKDIAELISQLFRPDQSYILFGSSLGATAILEACHLLSQPPKAIALVAPNAEFRLPPGGRLFVRLFHPGVYGFIKPLIKWYLKSFRLNLKHDQAQYKKYCDNLDVADPWKLKKAMLAFADYKVWKRLSAIKTPTLLIGASKDKLHEPANIAGMRKMLAGATFVDLETNQRTHSAEMVLVLYDFIRSL